MKIKTKAKTKTRTKSKLKRTESLRVTKPLETLTMFCGGTGFYSESHFLKLSPIVCVFCLKLSFSYSLILSSYSY